MKLATIAFRQVRRNRARSLLTVLGVAIAMSAFGFLRTVLAVWYSGVEGASAERLVTRNATAIVQPLPIAYQAKIASIPGVTQVAPASIFFGTFRNRDDVIGAFATEADPFLALYPEFKIAPDEVRAWKADPSGCIAGERMANKYGLHIGDSITLQGTSYPGEWKFTIRGIYRPREKSTDTSGMAIHWKYLDESVEPERRGLPNVFIIGIANPNDSPRISRAIDEMFHDTPIQTRTESEKAFQLSFLSMVSAVIHALQVVAAFVLVIMGLILGNTVAMAVRERTSEIAVLKAIGFSGRDLALLFTGESAVLAALGGGLGILITRPLMVFFAALTEEAAGGALPPFVLTGSSMALMFGVAVGVSILAAIVPVLPVARRSVAEAFQRTP